MERADGMLRLASTHYIFSLDKDVQRTTNWKHVMEIFTDSDEEYLLLPFENNTETCLKRLLLDTTNTNCLKTLVNRARENARGCTGSYH